MTAPATHPNTASERARDQELAREFKKIEKRDWWVWGYSIFVVVLLAFVVIAFSLTAVWRGAETILNTDIKITDVVFGLIVLVVLFNVYAVSQAMLSKRLRRQLAENQGHSDLLRILAMVDPSTGVINRRFLDHAFAASRAR